MTELRQRYLQDLRLRNYSPKTLQTYVHCVSLFARYFKRSPGQLGPEHIREYQRYLVEEKKCSWSRFNQTVCALRFLYRNTLGRDWAVSHICRAAHLGADARVESSLMMPGIIISFVFSKQIRFVSRTTPL